MKRPNVIIVGGGPVGVALALDLGLRGISSVVVESRPTLANIPKGQGLSQRTLEHFYFWGLDKELRTARTLPPGYPIGEITAYGNLMSEYWHAPTGREAVGDFFFQKNERLPQYRTETVLRRKLETLKNVELRVGVTAEVVQSTEGVRATVTNERGESETLEADYLVGCDGGHSMVRKAAGIPRSGTDFDQKMALVVFGSRDLHAKLKRFPERSTYRVMHPDLHGYWKFFGRVDADENFFFHAPVKDDMRREDVDFKAILFDAAGFEFTFKVEHVGFWDLRTSVAATYQNGRIFIAGDAAHSHPPYGGYGLNNGLEDAVNLSWKLAACFAGWGGKLLLDTYSRERAPIFRDIAEDLIAKRIREDDTFLSRYNPSRNRVEFEAQWKARETDVGSRRRAYEPNYEASQIVFGPPDSKTTAHGAHSLRARAGHHLSPQMLSNGRNVFEELGQNFTLLALGVDSGDFQRAALARLIPLKVVHDLASSARNNYGAPLVLVRPDQHVAWTGETASDADAIMQRVTGQ